MFTLHFLTDFVDFEIVFSRCTMTSTSQRLRTADEVVREILMDYDSGDGDCLLDNDPDFDDSDTESSSFEASLDLDLDLNQQRANNGPALL